MDRRDDDYYEANASDIRFEDITSSKMNAKTLGRLRDGDDKRRNHLTLGRERWNDFQLGEGDDLGWLGYFIGRSVNLHRLYIQYLPEDDGGEQQMHAFSDGIARNQSIQKVVIDNVSNNGFAAIARALGNLSQLEELSLQTDDDAGLNINRCSALGTLLESGVSKLKKLRLDSNNIDDAGVVAFAHGLRSIGSSLKELDLRWNSIGNEGLSALVAGLANCTSLELLNLSYNDFSNEGLLALSDWLQRDQMNLKRLNLESCGIDDEGLQALTEGATTHCKDLDLSGNDSITASGLRYLSASLQSEHCCLESLYIGGWEDIGDDAAEVLARGLVGNKSLRCLHLRDESEESWIALSQAGLNAFSKALCDTSSINNTYLSNHALQELYYWDDDDDLEGGFNLDGDERVVQYLQLHKEHPDPEHAARCKILMNHAHLEMTPLLQWELKFLPLAVGWFEKAKPVTTLSIDDIDSDSESEGQALEESEEVFQSRVLTALYEFVRGMTEKVLERRDELALVAAYDDKIAMAEDESKWLREEKKRIRKERKRLREDVVQRDRKIAKLKEENKRLCGIVESVRKSLDD
eukprot:scaffold24379_cov115-Skeletonema_dohrnii-CCMP3373.AAC.3